MIFEFAVTPEVIEELVTSPNEQDQLLVIEFLKRILENGMLVDLKDGEWLDYLRQELAGGTGHLHEIMGLLDVLYDNSRIVWHPSSSTENLTWIDDAQQISRNCHIDGIVTTATQSLSFSPFTGSSFVFPPTGSQNWTNSWYGKRSRRLKKCESDFRDALEPIVRHARRLDLVDPYLNCHLSRYQKTIRLCADMLRNNSVSNPSLVIHAGDPGLGPKAESPHHRIKAWKGFIASLPNSVTYRVFLWGEQDNEKFHNRYIFTNQRIGISVPHGLDCHEPSRASSDYWVLKDRDVAEELLSRFTSGPKYNRLGKYRST